MFENIHVYVPKESLNSKDRIRVSGFIRGGGGGGGDKLIYTVVYKQLILVFHGPRSNLKVNPRPPGACKPPLKSCNLEMAMGASSEAT